MKYDALIASYEAVLRWIGNDRSAAPIEPDEEVAIGAYVTVWKEIQRLRALQQREAA